MREFRRWVLSAGGQAKVAKLLRVSRQTVNYWVRGEGTPKVKTLCRIHELSGIPFEVLSKIGR